MLTAMPRSLVSFVLSDQAGGVISAKPLNDQQTIQLSVDLPIEFAYRMLACEVTIQQDVAFAYQFGGELQVTNAMRGQNLGVTTHHASAATTESFSISPIVQQTYWNFAIPTFIMQSMSPGIAPVITARLVNNTAPAGLAGTINFLCRFLEYDIEQVQMFPPMVPAALTYQVGP